MKTRHILSVLVENHSGVLNRVVSLLRRRSFNIESITVGHSEQPGVSRMTIVVDGGAEEVVALLRTIAAERGAIRHFIDGLVHGGNDRAGQRLRDVANAAANEALGGLGIRVGESLHAAADLGEEIAGFELEVIVIEISHNQSSVIDSVFASRAHRAPRQNQGADGSERSGRMQAVGRGRAAVWTAGTCSRFGCTLGKSRRRRTCGPCSQSGNRFPQSIPSSALPATSNRARPGFDL